MPPHCDSPDGPVITAAAAALEQRKVELVGLEVWSHSIYEALHADPHEHGHSHEH